MSGPVTSLTFHENARAACKDASLRQSLKKCTGIFQKKRREAVQALPLEELRDQASAIKLQVLDDLGAYVDRFAASATRAGAVVHRAKDAAAARETIFHILKDRSATKIVKSKSMVTEEIHLNEHLHRRGMQVIETDLGEYIVQLAGEKPSHILAPAIHKNRQQIGKLFAEKLRVPYTEDHLELLKIARDTLRQDFLTADAGITGANFALADTGSVVLVTNEGNGRMATTLPRLHIAVLTLEKIIPSLADLATFMRLLPRSASGQILSSYVSLITGPKKQGESTGAEEVHIVLVDNGRSEIVAGDCREILKCIRCSACLNACPVYATIGGHAYGSTYPGPMGIILTVLLDGMDKAYPLLDGTTLCGACDEVCPVKVPLTKMLATLRERRIAEGLTSTSEKAAMAGFKHAVNSPRAFDWGQRALRRLWPGLVLLSGEKILGRVPQPADRSLRRRMS
ncbi:MAG: iron-sulfur cluster-binding protein [Desulfomonile tiedjei]|nr:iron-sulfur cluster-binding protein [Desulfomonile tiedjei]